MKNLAGATQAGKPATVTDKSAQGASTKATSKKGVSRKKAASQSLKGAKVGTAAASIGHDAPSPGKTASRGRSKAVGNSSGSKSAKVLDMIGRPKGATLGELIAYASHCTSLA